MTADASPPTDVQRPEPLTEAELACCDYRDHSPGPCACARHKRDALHPLGRAPLTDEQLAAWEHIISNTEGIRPTDAEMLRLIADLRASRAEVSLRVGELKSAQDHAMSMEEALSAQTAELKRVHLKLSASRAEVERLREDARENYARAEQAEQELQRLKATAHLP